VIWAENYYQPAEHYFRSMSSERDSNQHGRRRLSNRTKHRQTVNFFSMWKVAALVRERRFSVASQNLAAGFTTAADFAYLLGATLSEPLTRLPKSARIFALFQR
jgi:hypothetical protein